MVSQFRWEVQKGMKWTADSYYALGYWLLAEAGVRHPRFHDRGFYGHAYVESRSVYSPIPSTRRGLFVLAHECGHIALRHSAPLPRHVGEYEAEQYAHNALQRFGIKVPKQASVQSRENIAEYVESAARRHPYILDREIVEWCQDYLCDSTLAAIRSGRIELLEPRRQSKRWGTVPNTA